MSSVINNGDFLTLKRDTRFYFINSLDSKPLVKNCNVLILDITVSSVTGLICFAVFADGSILQRIVKDEEILKIFYF